MSPNGAGVPQRFLRTPEAARFLGLSDRTLEKHRTYGTGPAYRKLGGRVVYATCSVLEAENEAIVRAFTESHPDFEMLDAAGDLRGKEIPEAVFTESGVVARQGNDGRGGLAAFAYHDEANSGAGRGCALRIGWPGVKPVNWFFYLACESLVKPGKTGGTRGCGMIFLCGRGDCDPDHCLFSVKKGMSVYKMMSFSLNSGGFHVLQSV